MRAYPVTEPRKSSKCFKEQSDNWRPGSCFKIFASCVFGCSRLLIKLRFIRYLIDYCSSSQWLCNQRHLSNDGLLYCDLFRSATSFVAKMERHWGMRVITRVLWLSLSTSAGVKVAFWGVSRSPRCTLYTRGCLKSFFSSQHASFHSDSYALITGFMLSCGFAWFFCSLLFGKSWPNPCR